jgi:hypothetical protein
MSIDSSDLSGSSSSDWSSDIDEEAIMDQIESDLYNQRIARAWEIVNCRQAELELADVEMGGTVGSISLADQDSQDNQDCQGGQDGQGDGPGGVSSRVSGGITT